MTIYVNGIESISRERNKTRAVTSEWGRKASIIFRASRQESGLSQYAVAQRCGWTRNMVANIESGRTRMSVQDLMEFATALELDPHDLLRRIIQW